MNERDDGFGLGIQRCDPEKIACRTCENALKNDNGYTKAVCYAYDGVNTGVKPDTVYFENAKCEKYSEGADLMAQK